MEQDIETIRTKVDAIHEVIVEHRGFRAAMRLRQVVGVHLSSRPACGAGRRDFPRPRRARPASLRSSPPARAAPRPRLQCIAFGLQLLDRLLGFLELLPCFRQQLRRATILLDPWREFGLLCLEARVGVSRPGDVIGNAVHVMRLATGELTEDIPTPESEGKDPAAVALGRKGGKARAEGMSARRRKEIAKKRQKPVWRD